MKHSVLPPARKSFQHSASAHRGPGLRRGVRTVRHVPVRDAAAPSEVGQLRMFACFVHAEVAVWVLDAGAVQPELDDKVGAVELSAVIEPAGHALQDVLYCLWRRVRAQPQRDGAGLCLDPKRGRRCCSARRRRRAHRGWLPLQLLPPTQSAAGSMYLGTSTDCATIGRFFQLKRR